MGSVDHSDAPSVRVRLDLAYDGAGFSGWAAQPGLRTVEGSLSEGLSRILREPVRLVVAGRTDAGVHAAAQVAHVDVPVDRWEALPGRSTSAPPQALVRRLAGVLEPDMVVRSASVVSADFDARFAALWRQYCYRLCDEFGARDPATRGRVAWVTGSLDHQAMHHGAQGLIGEHDFAAYCRPRPGATTVRRLLRLDVVRPGPGLVDVWVRADAFCHNMVRALVGTLVDVGKGRRDTHYPAQVLASLSRRGAGAVMPAHGLTLEEVAYPPPELWRTQVATARSGTRTTGHAL